MAGIAEFIGDPSALVGKEMPVLVNVDTHGQSPWCSVKGIEPRRLRGYDSHGMILATDVDGHPILLHPEKEVPPGSIVR